ncbi:MAG: asparaginase [Chloroflexi bacterium]|nr:asparaginase [Chloroflexota bacterium]
MQPSPFIPLVEVTRGTIVESVHYGAITICDTSGNINTSIGDPDLVSYLRSSAKPFQILPFVEGGGMDHFDLSLRELSVMCASHFGTDEHIRVISGIQKKLGVSASDLLCGMHTPLDVVTAERMFLGHETNTPLRHNCSGKHTGMLANCLLHQFPISDYINPSHPIQKIILKTFSEITGVPINEIALGTDGCSAPVFAVPLRNAALAFAKLADPSLLPQPRRSALQLIFQAMTTYPDMVSGANTFDTLLMETGKGKILSKGGAEGFQAIALLPGACGKNSPALGIALKISDGDLAERDRDPRLANIASDYGGRARSTVVVSLLHQLGALDDDQLSALKPFNRRPQFNWKHIPVGEIRAVFTLG